MKVPRTMSTQHPDNATPPFFSEGSILEGEDEIQEAFYVYSHLGCEEQMWDFEGKEGDGYAVKKLLSRYKEFFRSQKLGEDRRLTIRGPNPDVEVSEAKILLEILESVPRSFDAAKLFYEDNNMEASPPIFEVIIPMVTGSTQLDLVHDYYRKRVTGRTDEELSGGRSLSDWVGEFRPEEISVIPLIENRESMLSADQIVRDYIKGRDIDHQRVFLARSDPAMNYGSLAADLINKISLQRLYRMGEKTGTEIHPIFGAGAVPFRGNFSPETTEEILEAYSEVETFTVQSAFKYDYPVKQAADAIDSINKAELGSGPERINEEKALEVIDRTAEEYSRQVEKVVPVVNRMAGHIPDRRARKLHIGLFGYSREVGENSLPRAITFTSTLYSLGFPPTLMGLSGLEDRDLEFVEEAFPQFYSNLEKALKYYNPKSLEIIDIPEEEIEPATGIVDYERDQKHREVTDRIIENVKKGSDHRLEEKIAEAARTRNFLG